MTTDDGSIFIDTDPYFDLRLMNELALGYRRQMTAEVFLGKKGERYDGEEWERLADYWDGRCSLAEAQLAREIGL